MYMYVCITIILTPLLCSSRYRSGPVPLVWVVRAYLINGGSEFKGNTTLILVWISDYIMYDSTVLFNQFIINLYTIIQ